MRRGRRKITRLFKRPSSKSTSSCKCPDITSGHFVDARNNRHCLPRQLPCLIQRSIRWRSIRFEKIIWRRGRDSNPRYPCEYAAFRVRCFQPLSHLSAKHSRANRPSVAGFSYGRRRRRTRWICKVGVQAGGRAAHAPDPASRTRPTHLLFTPPKSSRKCQIRPLFKHLRPESGPFSLTAPAPGVISGHSHA